MTSSLVDTRYALGLICDAMTTGRKGGRGRLLEPAPNYLSLAYRGLKEVPRESVAGLDQVEILDLSHNEISYPLIAVFCCCVLVYSNLRRTFSITHSLLTIVCFPRLVPRHVHLYLDVSDKSIHVQQHETSCQSYDTVG